MNMQVVAYTLVTPDYIPAKIYVNETADALHNMTASYQGLPQQALPGNCSDLLSGLSAASAMSRDVRGEGWQPGPDDIAAVSQCLKGVGADTSSNATSSALTIVGQLLQAFIDSNGCVIRHPSPHVRHCHHEHYSFVR
jgi:hypothetical protein